MIGRFYLTTLLAGVAFLAVANSLRIGQINQGKDDVFLTEGMLSNSNSLLLHLDPTLIQQKFGSNRYVDSDNRPGLRLMLNYGTNGASLGNVRGSRGLMIGAGTQNGGALQTNAIEVFATDDKDRIVVMVLENGPLYTSTNSGLTWQVTTAPGRHDFALMPEGSGGGFFARATLAVPQPPLLSKWRAFAAAQDSTKIFLTCDDAQPSPAIGIFASDERTIVSWPSSFTNYSLQAGRDMLAANWVPITNSVITNGGEMRIITPPGDSNYYRLKAQ